MAGIIQVLLPLACVVLAEAQLHLPFFNNIPGLHHPARPISDGPRDNRLTHKNVGYNGGYDSWFQHFGNPDEHQHSSEGHERGNSYEDYDSFYHGGPYYQGNGWDQMPGINNVFNIPYQGYNSHRHLPAPYNNPQEKPKQVQNDGTTNIHKPKDKPKEIPPIDKKPGELDKGPKLNDADIPEVKNKLNAANNPDVKDNSDQLPPKTNEIKKEDSKGDKDKQVGLEKKKDFLLIGQGNNANSVYLLHENNPNPSTVVTTNANQPGNNIIYVPYNPGQSNNPVYQVYNGQPAPLPTNIQMAPDKVGVNANPGHSTTNLNAGNQNPGYVSIYSNGQLIQIPGVVVNSAPNNVPLQNGNQVQGTNYIIANAVPNNVQTVPAIQNPGTNVIYASIPNQASSGPIYVQVPNCANAISNSCGSGAVVQNPIQGVNYGMSNNGLPSNVVVYQANPNTQPAGLPNDVSNAYIQPNTVANQGQGAISLAIPNQGAMLSNQNGPYRPAAEMPDNAGYNGYNNNQPIVLNSERGQSVPNQGGMMNNENMPIQTTVQMPVVTSNNGYNQPLVSNQGLGQIVPNQGEKQEVPFQGQYQPAVEMPNNRGSNGYNNVPNQGSMMNHQNVPIQNAVQMPVNSGYNQPMISNQAQGPNVPNQGFTIDSQNTPMQPAIKLPITNGYNDHPPVTNPSPTVNLQSRGDMPNNQNEQPQLAVPVDSTSNGYNQQGLNQGGDQGTNAIVNSPSNTEVIDQKSDVTQPDASSSLVLDSGNLSSLGAQPAIMISGLKDKSGDKKDKSKVKKQKKDKGKKKDKKPKDDDKTKVSKPFTNKKI